MVLFGDPRILCKFGMGGGKSTFFFSLAEVFHTQAGGFEEHER